ncbi:MAG: hypothetical protein IJA49_04895 [Oscillospiraceae bacterium]|nr:hypothetical protein [Oscillospiraceae bacterium]
MYCERCNRLVYETKCPGCGGKNLRMPAYDDHCFLAEPEPIWVQALEDLLRDNGVEFLTRRVHGAALVTKTGIPQRVRFFVPYRDYQRAKELNEAFFNGAFVFEGE